MLSSNQWEDVKKGGDSAIEKWIDEQMVGKSCCVVLIGSETADRKWVEYEIKKARDNGKGLLGIYMHNLKDGNGNTTSMGKNPFSGFTIDGGKVRLDSVVKTYNPSGRTSTDVYDTIKNNLASWVETAISDRSIR